MVKAGKLSSQIGRAGNSRTKKAALWESQTKAEAEVVWEQVISRVTSFATESSYILQWLSGTKCSSTNTFASMVTGSHSSLCG